VAVPAVVLVAASRMLGQGRILTWAYSPGWFFFTARM
jgi:hypothetical protein